MEPYRLTIHDGPHYTDKVLVSVKTIGSLDQIKTSVIVKLKQKRRTGRFWVEVFDGPSPVTHWILEII